MLLLLLMETLGVPMLCVLQVEMPMELLLTAIRECSQVLASQTMAGVDMNVVFVLAKSLLVC
jgi:hypothetical protein